MRFLLLMLAAPVLVGLGCTTTPGTERSGALGSEQTFDGLVQTEIDAPGKLFLRPNHGIGGYDAIVVAPAFVNYKRGSAKLTPDLENAYLASLEQSVIDFADAANVPRVNGVGECVLKIGIGFVNVDLARSASAKVLGKMTLVLDYQDSTSRQSLLRYVADEKVERESGGMSREAQVRASFDRMIDDVDIITALRKATVVPSSPRPGCEGKLVSVGQRVSPE